MLVADYKEIVPENTDPTPYWPKFMPKVTFRKTGDMKGRLGKYRNIYCIDIAFVTPKRARYVERYHLEFLATFRGWAKIRTLHVWTFYSLSRLRRQSQDKIKPIEGSWMDDYPFQRKHGRIKDSG